MSVLVVLSFSPPVQHAESPLLQFTEKFWKGELFYDLGKKTWFPAIHGGKKFTNTAGGIWSAITGGAVGKALKRAQGKAVEGNLKGEGTVLGGVWVVHPTQGVLYEYREKSWGDSVTENDLNGLMEAINKLPGRAPGQPVSMPGYPTALPLAGTPNMGKP